MRHFVSMLDARGRLEGLLREALRLKRGFRAGRPMKPLLKGRTLGMLFEKSSTRTRVSFEVGMQKLGGHAIYLSTREIQLGRGETIEDTARVLSRYVDLIVYRSYDHASVLELARHSTVPVMNGLSNLEHPCQVVADLMTVLERKKRLKGLQLLYVGDGNNMCNSYLVGAAMAGMHCRVVTPPDYGPDEEYVALARGEAGRTGARIEVRDEIDDAFRGVDVVATDTWVSMGDEGEKQERLKAFQGYTVDSTRMAQARKDAIFIHCLPAYYGNEVTREVAYGPQSAIFDEAENRMWAQMALMVDLSKRR